MEASVLVWYREDDLLSLSALQHLLFCERQCALIHIEEVWAENQLTVEGQHLHARTYQQGDERRGRRWMVRGLPLRSLELGLVGKAEVVEFEPPAGGDLPGLAASQLFRRVRETAGAGWRITLIEHKRGRPKKDPSDRVQLCAQALCLEEMLGLQITAGAIFYGRDGSLIARSGPCANLPCVPASLHECASLDATMRYDNRLRRH